jgi:hypothetical protein
VTEECDKLADEITKDLKAITARLTRLKGMIKKNKAKVSSLLSIFLFDPDAF